MDNFRLEGLRHHLLPPYSKLDSDYPHCYRFKCLSPSPFRAHEYLVRGTEYIMTKYYQFYHRRNCTDWVPVYFGDILDELPECVKEEFLFDLDLFI